MRRAARPQTPFLLAFLLAWGWTLVGANSSHAAPFYWDRETQGAFVMSLAPDHSGRVWAGTEGNGVWCFDPRAPQDTTWRHFTVQDGLGDDNAYAIAVDADNRVWVGHLNHGVSVYDGRTWKNYDATQGPLGERVFALAVSPQSGDVWMATNVGLTRYSAKTDGWRTYTAADGLPNSQINALACDGSGTVFVGTQTQGVAWSSPTEQFEQWHNVRGPSQDKLPLSPTGEGLPSNGITALLVTRPDNVIYAATTTSLARSYDAGQHWSWVRGEDWLQKARGLETPPTPAQLAPGLERQQEVKAQLLREDYLTCLAQDAQGDLWIGSRSAGGEIRRPHRADQDLSGEQVLFRSEVNPEMGAPPYITALLPLNPQQPYVALYQHGLAQIPVPRQVPNPTAAEGSKTETPRNGAAVAQLPSPRPAPALDELNALLQKVRAVPAADEDANPVTLLADDWRTQGDWLGRYGRYYARLHAMLSPDDYEWGAGAQSTEFAARIGAHITPGDSLRYWVQWLYTEDARSLEMPPVYLDSRVIAGLVPTAASIRRQSELDDHGEAYPITHQGPDLYLTLKVPQGAFYLSLYDCNKDGQGYSNRWRDYRVSVRPHPADLPMESIKGFEEWPELASGRIRDFWHGVYKRFLVSGPQTLTIQVNRNYSHNAILAGAFLDQVSEEPEPYFAQPTLTLAQERQARRARTAQLQLDHRADVAAVTTEAEAVEAIWRELERTKAENTAWWASEGRTVYARLLPWLEREAARPGVTGERTQSLEARLGTCYYQLAMFEPWEKSQQRRGLTTARAIEKGLRWNGKPGWSGQGRTAVIQAQVERKKATKTGTAPP